MLSSAAAGPEVSHVPDSVSNLLSTSIMSKGSRDMLSLLADISCHHATDLLQGAKRRPNPADLLVIVRMHVDKHALLS